MYAVGVLSVSGGSWRIAGLEFSHGANGINYAARMDMLRFGCPDARLRKVFRASSETDAAVKQFGDWGLLVKELLAVPMMEEEQP